MKFVPFLTKRSVTCKRTSAGHEKDDLFTITDEGNGSVLVTLHATAGRSEAWVRISIESFLGMIGSLWPDDVAIISEENEND